MRQRLILILFSILTIDSCFSQTHLEEINSHKFKKNAILGTAGSSPMYSAIIGHYERTVFQPSSSIVNSFGVRLSTGYAYVWTAEGGIIFASNLFTIFGRNINHLEVGAGILFAPWTSTNDYNLFPSFNLSYRYQEQCKPLIFRAGIGWPEAIHISCGFCF